MEKIYQEISKTLIDLILKEPFYGYFLMNIQKQETTKVSTMAVGTKNNIDITLYFNVEFWKSLTKDQKLGLCIHETLHLVYHHLLIAKNYANKKIHNIACDLEINQYIDRKLLPETGIFLDNFQKEFPKLKLEAKQGSDYYYKKLMEDPELTQQIEQMLGENEEHHWDLSNLTNEQINMIKDQIDHIISSTVEEVKRKKGNVPGNIKYLLELRKKELPKLDWKRYLRQWVTSNQEAYVKTSRFKPNVFFRENPSYKWKGKELILLAIDTSGSVSDSELQEFLIEINGMHKLNKVFDILCVDTNIQEPYRYNGELSLKISGRGGTDFDTMLSYFNESKKYTSMIFFTDGECGVSVKVSKPMLWVISSRGTDSYIKDSVNNSKILKIK